MIRRFGFLHILVIAAAIIGTVVFYAPYLSMSVAISPFWDTIYLTGPMFCDVSRSAQAGALPLLNWSSFEALDYNPHIAVYYPLYLFDWLDFCSVTAAAQAADIIMVVHIVIFTITMASLIRATDAGLAAAFGGAAIAATLPNTYAMANFPTFIAAVAWLPLALEGLVRLYYHRQYVVGALLLAAGTGAMLTAGPGTNLLSALVLSGLVMSIDAFVRLVLAKDRAAGIRVVVALAGAGCITIIVSLASTIHLFSHIGEIIRWTRSGAVIGNTGTANISEILTEQLGWRDLLQLLVPINVAYAAGCYLLGPAAVLLALLGAVRQWSKPVVRIFAILVIACIVLVFLSPQKVVLLWTLIPGLSHTRHLSLVATPLSIGIAVLAGHGLAELLQGNPVSRKSAVLFGVASLGVLAATVAGVMSYSPLQNVDPVWFITAVAAVSAIVFAAMASIQAGPARRFGAVALLVLQFAFVIGSIPRHDGRPVVAATELWKSIEAGLEHIKATDPDPGRVALHTSINVGELTYMSGGSIATYMGLPTFSHYSTPRIYWKFVHEIGLTGESNFGAFGGKYLLTAISLPDTLGSEVFRSGDIRVLLLNHRRPLVATICLQSDEFTVQNSTVRQPLGQLPLLEDALVQTVDSFQDGQKDCQTGTAETAARIDRVENAVDFSVPSGAKRVLVISMPPYASWQLWVGDRRLPLYNLREQQIVAVVPEDVFGEARLIYAPTSYRWLLRISEIGWFLLISAIAACFVRKRLRR